MALKIWLNGSMKKIDTNLHKPVTFINGTKYKLDKAYTFVNGQKQIIWGEGGVQIDYISSTGVLGGGIVFAIGENWANAWNNNIIYRININNLTSPSLIQSLEWGNITSCSYYQSTNTTAIFTAWKNKTGRKISMNVSDGSMSVTQTSTITTTYSGTTSIYLLGITNNKFVVDYGVLQQLRPNQIYLEHFFWNDTEKYTDTTTNASYRTFIQAANSSILVRYNLSGATSTRIYSFTENGMSPVGYTYGIVQSNYHIYDNGFIYYCSKMSNLYNLVKESASDIGTVLYRVEMPSGRQIIMIGKIGSYIYCLDLPTTNTINDEVKLKLFNESDLSVAYEKVLPNDPFNENSGLPTFWINATCVPQVGNTNFVGIGTYNSSTLGLRIARFSGLI